MVWLKAAERVAETQPEEEDGDGPGPLGATVRGSRAPGSGPVAESASDLTRRRRHAVVEEAALAAPGAGLVDADELAASASPAWKGKVVCEFQDRFNVGII